MSESKAVPPDAPAPRRAAPDEGTGPAWWRNALALEARGELEAAERAITEGAQHIGGAASVAEMYRQRMERLAAAGNAAGARAARDKAVQWITFYASLATSGGEGAALSRERDAFIASLGTTVKP